MPTMHDDPDILLNVTGLKVHFPVKSGLLRGTVGHIKAVDGVNFFVRKGETLGLVGESGCGKTTTGRAVIRLVKATEGQVQYRTADNHIHEFLQLKRGQLRTLRKDIQMIFQDPYASLNPSMTVNTIIAEPLNVYGVGNRRSRRERVHELLELVGLSGEHMNRFPHEFSGGQRQRIGIARALALNPRLIICDEPVSALDVSVQAQILNLLEDLKEELSLSYLFIAHNLSVIHHVSNRIAVMYLGKIVELADNKTLYQNPRHPYTEALMSAIPAPDPEIRPDHILLPEEVPDPSNPPPGCPFHTRCSYAIERCRIEQPTFTAVSHDPSHFVACHRTQELTLQPAPHQHLAVRQHVLDIEALRRPSDTASGGNGAHNEAFEGDPHDQ
jgi:oligopeptide/dipeptide ABC transporter ATP-binding protein